MRSSKGGSLILNFRGPRKRIQTQFLLSISPNNSYFCNQNLCCSCKMITRNCFGYKGSKKLRLINYRNSLKSSKRFQILKENNSILKLNNFKRSRTILKEKNKVKQIKIASNSPIRILKLGIYIETYIYIILII